MKYFHKYLEEEFKKLGTKVPTDDQIKEAMTNSFERIEKEWIEVSRKTFNAGFPDVAYTGSCALVSVITNNKVYTANAGDSKAAIYRRNNKYEKLERIKVSKSFNANKRYE